jgi:hypothetical protein
MSEYGKIHTDGSRSGGQPVDDSIEQKALALVNEVREERHYPLQATIYRVADAEVEALCRAIERHEAFKQEVSDAIENAFSYCKDWDVHPSLWRLIIPKPKPDPVVDVFDELGWHKSDTQELRAALEARGLEIRSKNDE